MMDHKINFLKVWFTNQLVNEFKNSKVLVVILVIFCRSMRRSWYFLNLGDEIQCLAFIFKRGTKLSFLLNCVLLIGKAYLWWKPGVSILGVFPETNMSPKSNWMDLNTLVQLNPTQTDPKDVRSTCSIGLILDRNHKPATFKFKA